MPCITLTDITKGCSPSFGGIKTLYIAKRSSLTYVKFSTVSGAYTDKEVTDITLMIKSVHKIEGAKDTASFTFNSNIDAATGIVEYTETLSFKLNGVTLIRNAQMDALLQGLYEWVVFFEDNNGQYWMSGYPIGITVDSVTGTLGTDLKSGTNYNVSMSCVRPDTPISLTSKCWRKVLASL